MSQSKRVLGTPSAWDPAARALCTACGRFHPTVLNRDPEAVGLLCADCVDRGTYQRQHSLLSRVMRREEA